MQRPSTSQSLLLGLFIACVVFLTFCNLELGTHRGGQAHKLGDDASASGASISAMGGDEKLGAGLLFVWKGDDRNRILLLKRTSRHNHQTWGLPGGNLAAQDTGDLLNTAVREATEELGRLPGKFEVTGSFITRRGKRNHKQYTVFVALVGPSTGAQYTPQLNLKEHSEWRWFDLPGLLQLASLTEEEAMEGTDDGSGGSGAVPLGGPLAGVRLHPVVALALGPRLRPKLVPLLKSNKVIPGALSQ